MKTKIKLPFSIKGVLYLCSMLFSFYCLFIGWSIVREAFGRTAAFIGLLIFPVEIILAPWYALIAWGNWCPLAIIYGGWLGIIILFSLASLIEE